MAQPLPAGRPEHRSVKHRLRPWFGSGPRRRGEPLIGRSVSYLELFYDLVFVVLVSQAGTRWRCTPGCAGRSSSRSCSA
ncbi:MAG: hypothetical protein U0S36_13410 [Candidatus Nanopelagicales bacterium]